MSATYIIFKQRKFFAEFKISPPVFIRFMSKIQNEYIATNPYHNSMHAADVFLVTNYLLKAKALEVGRGGEGRGGGWVGRGGEGGEGGGGEEVTGVYM